MRSPCCARAPPSWSPGAFSSATECAALPPAHGREGALSLACSGVNDSTYAVSFADRLLVHFRRGGADLSQLVLQTDHGSQFGGDWNRRHGLPRVARQHAA